MNLIKGAGKTTVLELLKKLDNPDWKLIDEPVAKWRKVKNLILQAVNHSHLPGLSGAFFR